MRAIATMAAILMGTTMSNAQEFGGTTSGTFIIAKVPKSRTLAIFGPTGDVRIDWSEVEKAITDPETDPVLRGYARLMVAVRDGTWKPMRTHD